MDLYVSDLDGTLLGPDAKLSDETIEAINKLIAEGVNFTIATARSFESAYRIIHPLKIKLPMIFHNGVYIYDPVEQKYIKQNTMDIKVSCEIVKFFEDNKVIPIVHGVNQNDEDKVYYKGIFHHGEAAYINERLASKDKRMTQVADFDIFESNKILSIMAINDDEILLPLYNTLRNKYELIFHYGEDIYSKTYWLEISNNNADKRHAVEYLKNYLKADRLICFGDNLNDLSMFQTADFGYAVENAVDDLKRIATQVIESNTQNGVANFIRKLVG